jgi:hypothetical protein
MIGMDQEGFMGMDPGDSNGDSKAIVIGLPYTASVCRALAKHVTHVMPIPLLAKHLDMDRTILHAKGIMNKGADVSERMDSADIIELSMLNEPKSFERYAIHTIHSEAEGRGVLHCASAATYGESMLVADVRMLQDSVCDLEYSLKATDAVLKQVVRDRMEEGNDDSN